jgi:hypothetical protein
MKTRRCFYYGKFAVFGIAGLVAFTFVVMWLWNWLVPGLFSGPAVTWWQALGLLLLSKILLTGVIGHGPGSHPRHDHEFPWKERERWRMKFEARMDGKAGKEEPGSEANAGV